ncbi:hypothetical protein [Pseudomonas pharyngis]|uniref:hypothetical protein n=1 Tax=Pseudomonas pharyngis TaxID=2892333 RepID=UPI001F21FA9E|nr:hypothetical protein [Pseudomonas pharyngis]
MESVFVQFSDSEEAVVLSVFGCPQDPSEYPNQQEISVEDPRYLKFISPPITEPATDPLEKLKAFLAANPDVAAILG